MHWMSYKVDAPTAAIIDSRADLYGLSVGVSTLGGCHTMSWQQWQGLPVGVFILDTQNSGLTKGVVG